MASPSTGITVSSAFMRRLSIVIPTVSQCEAEGSVWAGGVVATVLAVILTGCAAGPARVPAPAPQPQTPYGFTVEEEARILRLEDRREYDAALVQQWVHHPNSLHRARIALALGRIGPHTFIDLNGNG